MTTDLPGDREKALDAIASGWTRRPTAAHPDCICHQPIPGTRSGFVDFDGNPVPRRHDAKECPVHTGH